VTDWVPMLPIIATVLIYGAVLRWFVRKVIDGN
jgi:hypothetical protein